MSRLTPIGPAEPERKEMWSYLCLCGAVVSKPRRAVASGRLKSCGCLNRELRIARNTKHGRAVRGHSDTVYWVWAAMRGRCTRPSHKDYHLYGARGVSVCSRWDSYETFREDMGERPLGHSLDRINPNGNYEPSNCRWATASEQRRNQRRMAERTP
jgi:hypothetical protein